MVPLLALGVPPHPVMAMLLGAFIIHGIQPGPFFITQHPDLFWGIIASMYIGNIMLLVLNLPLIGIWVKILKIPYRLLFPLIILFCFIGVYSLNNNFYELLIMIFFGFFGYILRKLEYTRALPPGHGLGANDGDQFLPVYGHIYGRPCHFLSAALFRYSSDHGFFAFGLQAYLKDCPKTSACR